MKSFIIASLIVFLVVPAHSASVQLSWDLNSEPDVQGYNVYFGRYSGNTKVMPAATKVANVQPGAIIPVDPLGTWYFRVSAYNGSMESLLSNLVSVKWVKTPAALKLQKVEIR